jgi:hypothetical protein
MNTEKLTVPLLDIEEPEPPHDAHGAALGRAAVSAAIELMQARLAEPPHRDLSVLRRIGVLLAAISVALVLGAAVHHAWGGEPPRDPYSCRLLYDEQKKCAFGSCDKRTLERLRNECLRAGGRAGDDFMGAGQIS